jgi:hypothetical protein
MSVNSLRMLHIGRIAVFGCVLILLSIIPFEFIEGGPTICVFKNILGIECPGCGMTRAFSYMLHGDLIAAVSYNRLVVIVFPLFCLVLIREIFSLLKEFVICRYLSPPPKIKRGGGSYDTGISVTPSHLPLF